MRKQANIFDTLLGTWNSMATGAQTLAIGSLVAAAGLGTAAGKLAAKATAASDTDISAMGRAYELEREKADIDYLSSRLNLEFNAPKVDKSRNSARVLNV